MGDDHWEQLTYLYNNITSIGLGYFSSPLHEVHLVSEAAKKLDLNYRVFNLEQKYVLE